MTAGVLSRIRRRLHAPNHTSAGSKPPGPRAADAMSGVNIYDSYLSDEDIAAGRHRLQVGGMWDKIGPAQLAFLVDQGLKPNDVLLDVGSGAMRGGIHFASYLEPGHYFGIDINDRLIEAALRVEVPAAGLVGRVPPGNLRVTDSFDANFGITFDVAIALSVFTHLPLNHIRLCLAQTAKVMAPGGRFFATFFMVPDGLRYDQDIRRRVGLTTHSTRDPFHYRVSEMEWAATVGPWDFTYIGDWGHPRGQHMALFTRRAG